MSEKKKRILVIDDQPSELKMVKMVLEGADYDVVCVHSGREGVELINNSTFDLVLIDVIMPDMGGMMVLGEIKKTNPHLPVVMMTGYASVSMAVQAIKLGALDYLVKGLTPLKLISSIESALAKAKKEMMESEDPTHKEELLKVLERAAFDPRFTSRLLYQKTEVLDTYSLTGAEKRAILTGDIEWIESHIGKLSAAQKLWLEHREQSELWY